MKYQVIAHEHIFPTEEFFPQCHASTIERLPDGSLLSAWFAGSYEGHRDVGIWGAHRSSSGWSDPVVLAQHEEDGKPVPCWNPVLFWNGQQLFLYYKVGMKIPTWRTYYKTSTDGGHHWSEARLLVEDDIGGRGPVKNKCITLSCGRVLAPASLEDASRWDCFVDYSDDGGLHWTKSQLVPLEHRQLHKLGVIQPTLWEDREHPGRVHMLMRSTEGAIYESLSEDRGEHWSHAKRTALPNNNSGIDLAQLEDGRLILVYNPVTEGQRTPIAFTISSDNGATWAAPQILEHASGNEEIKAAEFSYPAIVAKGNTAHITYTWNRRTIAYWHLSFTSPHSQKV